MKQDTFSFYEPSDQSRPLTIVSIPLELGSDERGLALAPAYLFEQGLEKMLASLSRPIAQQSTIPCPKGPHERATGPMKYAQEIVEVAKRSAVAVEEGAKRGDLVLALGGDHAAAIGSIAGAAAAHPSMGVIYIDAHPDCNTDATTITGNVHGMVTSALMGEGSPLLTDIAERTIPPDHFLYIGIKDIDQAEIRFLRERSLACVTMLDIATHSLAPALAAIDALSKKVDSVWVSMDMDSIDRMYAPGVGLPNSDGFTRREILGLAHYIGKTCKLAGLDVVEISPEKDIEQKTARLALELTARFLGAEYSWYQSEYIDGYR